MSSPNLRVEIRKSWNGHSWGNDYLIHAADMDAGQAFAGQALAFERNMHETVVHFEGIRISTTLVGDRSFRHIPVNNFGLATNGSTNLLPLWNVLRFDFQTADSDPCRKYYRLPIPEVNQDNGNIAGAVLTAYQTFFNTFFASLDASTTIVSTKGHVVVGGSPYALVQMRQLHRHKRKKVTIPA